MNAVIDTVSQTIRECVSAIPVSPDLLAITAQGDGLWLTRDDGSPVRPAIVWSDTRAFGHVDEWFRNGIAAAAFRQSEMCHLQAPRRHCCWRWKPQSRNRSIKPELLPIARMSCSRPSLCALNRRLRRIVALPRSAFPRL